MLKKNKRIRDYAKAHNVFLWELADRIGISESWLVRKLRKELSTEEADKMMGYIDEIAADRQRG